MKRLTTETYLEKIDRYKKTNSAAYLFGTQEMMMVTMKKQKKKYTSKNVLDHNLFLEADMFL